MVLFAVRRARCALGLLAVALLAVLLVVAPMRATRAASTVPGRGVQTAANDHQRDHPDTPGHHRAVTHVFLDRHAVDALSPDVPAIGRSSVNHDVVRPSSSSPISNLAEVCSRGPPAGARVF